MRKSILPNVLLVVCSTAFALGIGELYFRYVMRVHHHVQIPTGLFDNDPRAGWRLSAGFRATFDTPDGTVTFTVNSQGVRAPDRAGREYARRAQGTAPRIFVSGDSYVFGWLVNDEDAFPSVLERKLRASGRPAEVVNLGVPGYGTRQSFDRLAEYVERIGKPDYVIYLFCPNDPIDDVAGRKEVVNGVRIDSDLRFKYLLSWVSRIYQHSRLVAYVIDAIYTVGWNPRVAANIEMRTIPVNVEDREDTIANLRNVQRWIDWARAQGVKLIVGETHSSEYSPGLRELLRKNGVPSVTVASFINASGEKRPTRLAFDKYHWNALGNDLAARAFEPLLAN